LKGSIPGSKNTEVVIKKSVKNVRKLTMTEKIAEIERIKKIPEKKKK
jgi:large subunit ribosomal protein L3